MNPFHIFASVSAMNCVSAMNPDNLKKEKVWEATATAEQSMAST